MTQKEGPAAPSRFIVITGGPGSGKTSLVNYLATLGYGTVPEAAIQIIDELSSRYGVAGQVNWRREQPDEFQRLVARRQAALEGSVLAGTGGLVFCDRGRPDALAYAWLVGVKLDGEVQSLIERQRYLGVFLLDTPRCFQERPATGRTSDRARSVRIHRLLDEAYRSLGYTPARVPELPTEERAWLILSALGGSR
jgi:predicted ATPase